MKSAGTEIAESIKILRHDYDPTRTNSFYYGPNSCDVRILFDVVIVFKYIYVSIGAPYALGVILCGTIVVIASLYIYTFLFPI